MICHIVINFLLDLQHRFINRFDANLQAEINQWVGKGCDRIKRHTDPAFLAAERQRYFEALVLNNEIFKLVLQHNSYFFRVLRTQEAWDFHAIVCRVEVDKEMMVAGGTIFS